MAFTFPTDSNGKAGAIVVTNSGNSFQVPTILYNSIGTSPIDSSTPLPVQVSSSGIVIPVEVKNTDRQFLFTTSANLASGGAYVSPVYDFAGTKKIAGFASSDQSGNIYLQQSDDQSAWYNVGVVSVPIASSTSISGVTYYDGTSFNNDVIMRYARIAYVNGNVAQTRFILSTYSSSL